MKRKNALMFGNVLMGLGLVIMVGGVGYSLLTQIPQLGLPKFLSNGAIMSIFVGALLWLAGARVGGRERIAERYWWARRDNKRCCHSSHKHRS